MEIDINRVKSIIIPGGDVSSIENERVYKLLRAIKDRGNIVAGICVGVDVLDYASIINDVKSMNSVDLDIFRDNYIITVRANAYIDFAVEVEKEMELFEDEADLQKTVNF